MNSSLVTILKFIYSLKKWPQKILVVLFFPSLLSVAIFSFLTLRPSVYISTAKLELLAKKKLEQKINQRSVSTKQEDLINLNQQLSLQIQDDRMLFALACKLSAFDLSRMKDIEGFQKRLGIRTPEIYKHLRVRLEETSLIVQDSLPVPELDHLVRNTLTELGNEPEHLKDRIHVQWVPESSHVLLKSYDKDHERANFIVNTISELSVVYQKMIGLNHTFPIIKAQKILISNQRESWEASKERIRQEQETINAGKGPDPIQEISRKILALKHSLIDIEERIIYLRKKMRKKREAEKQASPIISVRYIPDDQEALVIELSQKLNELRQINSELMSLQEKLKRYKQLHLNNLYDQEKNQRKSLIQAQEYLQELLSKNAESLTEVRIIESAKTIPDNMHAIWILTAFSFVAGLALWLILLLRIRYFQ